MIDQNLQDNLLKVDPDRYRAAMFADQKSRDRLLTLYAFHAELAKVPELVSEPMIGNIRYQWWRDAVDEIYSGGRVRNHEVVTPLTQVLRDGDVPRYWVDQLINGRERDLDPTPFKDIDYAKDYCRQTSGVLTALAVSLCVKDFDEENLTKAGEAWGLTGLARSWMYYKGTILSEVTFDSLCDAAQDSYSQARKGLGKSSEKLIPAIGYAGLIPKYLSRLRSTKFDPSQDKLTYPVLLKQLRLMGVVMTGRI